ncbi:MAG: MerR family DNA-binding transcriptional regulator, partial [Clostridium sp.]
MKRLYSIGEISNIFNVSTFTIRFYEKKGLLLPIIDDKN